MRAAPPSPPQKEGPFFPRFKDGGILAWSGEQNLFWKDFMARFARSMILFYLSEFVSIDQTNYSSSIETNSYFMPKNRCYLFINKKRCCKLFVNSPQ
jgi:hypothetical protein